MATAKPKPDYKPLPRVKHVDARTELLHCINNDNDDQTSESSKSYGTRSHVGTSIAGTEADRRREYREQKIEEYRLVLVKAQILGWKC